MSHIKKNQKLSQSKEGVVVLTLQQYRSMITNAGQSKSPEPIIKRANAYESNSRKQIVATSKYPMSEREMLIRAYEGISLIPLTDYCKMIGVCYNTARNIAEVNNSLKKEKGRYYVNRQSSFESNRDSKKKS